MRWGHHILERGGQWNAAVAGVLLCSLAAVPGRALPVVNPGFEDISGESPSNQFTFGPFNGWGLYDPDGVTQGGMGGTYFIGTLTPFEPDPVGNPGVFANFPGGAAEGQRVALAFNFQGSDGQGEYGLAQTLDDTLQPHTAYRLHVEIGNITSATAMNGTFFPLLGFPGYRVDLLAGGVVIASDDNTLAGLIPDGEFGTSAINFTADENHPLLGQPLGIRLVSLNTLDPAFPESDLEVNFDDVRLTAALLGDMDTDGTLTLDDVTAFVQALENPDSYAAQFGHPPTQHGDFTADGLFNLDDIEPFVQRFGAASLAELLAVPEPATAWLGLASLLLLGRGRSRDSKITLL